MYILDDMEDLKESMAIKVSSTFLTSSTSSQLNSNSNGSISTPSNFHFFILFFVFN